MDSTQLFLALKNAGVKADADGPLWWPNAGTFEVVVGAVLIQNTNWKNADKALNNLKNANLMSVEGIVKTPAAELALLIKPSGFYNTKAKRLKTLCDAIFKKFGDFENFKENVSREWLLGIKGLMHQHYTQARLAQYFDGNEIVLDNNKNPVVRRIQDQVNKELDGKFSQIETYLGREMWQETYLNRQGEAVEQPNSVQHSVPAWLIFGMFFIMIPLSNVMAMERQTNTLTRLNMARAPAWKLLAAKLIPYFLINQLQFAGMITLGAWVLPLLGMPAFALAGGWAGYAAVSCAVSLAALGYGLLVSVLAKTTEHAVVLGGGGIIIMAALGGVMVPVHIMPALMQQISQLSPMGWGLSAFQKLLLNHYTLAQIAPQLLRLAGFGLVALAAAAALYRRQLKTQARF